MLGLGVCRYEIVCRFLFIPTYRGGTDCLVRATTRRLDKVWTQAELVSGLVSTNAQVETAAYCLRLSAVNCGCGGLTVLCAFL